MNEKIRQLIEKSKKILKDVALDNGAIVAANSDKPYYPSSAKDYHYVWPRDAGFICVAANMVGVHTIQEPFFQWLLERPEDFKKEGILFASYSPNGRKAVDQFQPDQAGTMLWALYDFYHDHPSECMRQELLIRRLADGLCSDWKGKFFFRNTVDLWEEGNRKTSTKMENNHTYSLAACAKGLLLADQMIPHAQWMKTAQEMIAKIQEAYRPKLKRFVRNHGKIDDPNVDASLLGLVYPFEIMEAKDPRMVQTVQRMEKNIVDGGGVHRYQFDYYDGEGTAQEGGGAWPVLNFWLSIYHAKTGAKEKALTYFNWVLERIGDDLLIPEQIFPDFREGIKPLAWSHAMFIVASKFLGYIQ